MKSIPIPDISVIECNCDDDAAVIDKYECMECNLSIEYGCECYLDSECETLTLYCHGCNSASKVEVDDLFDEYEYDFEEETETAKQEIEGVDYRVVTRCRHYDHPVDFGEVKIYASSEFERDYDDDGPDFGLYLDSIWRPDCLAYLVEWDDYGLPKRWNIAAFAIIDCYNKAKMGLWVEVGCIGGHGRTGTALACFGVLAGMKPDEAVAHVRANYCKEAIETKEQEWWVKWFYTLVNGGKITKPKHGSTDLYAGEKWHFTGKFNVDQYCITDFPLGAPTEEGGVCYYNVKIPIDKDKTSVQVFPESKYRKNFMSVSDYLDDEEPF